MAGKIWSEAVVLAVRQQNIQPNLNDDGISEPGFHRVIFPLAQAKLSDI